MKTAASILAVIVLAGVAFGAVAYVDGSHLPVQHTVSVAGIVNAPPAKVWEYITNVEQVPNWRTSVKAVTMLQQDQGRDHWVEHLAHGRYMTFLAVHTETMTRREVRLDEPNAPYGGTWVYVLTPGPAPSTTSLRITETGYINPPIYRFLAARFFGPTHNLDSYMNDIQKAASKS